MSTTADEVKETAQRTSVYVYEVPVRLWHWINALSITVLAVTGYFIGSPLPSVPGEASDQFLMGYIRFAHFAAGYILAIGFLGRIYWAIVGNSHARELFYIPFWRKDYWQELLHEARWYFYMVGEPKKYIGHNPLGRFMMVTFFTATTLFMILTGGALYAEGAGMDSWQHALFGWVINLFGNTQNLHTWHHVGMWVMVTFVIVHVYAAIREDILSRQSLISTMISGERMFKDNRP